MGTLWGTGTRFYGDSEFNPRDGSYITTKWVTLVFVPMIPLGSFRIWPEEDQTRFSIFPLGMGANNGVSGSES